METGFTEEGICEEGFEDIVSVRVDRRKIVLGQRSTKIDF